MAELTQSLQRVIYADPDAIRSLYYDLKRTEVSDGIAGFSPEEAQSAADLLTVPYKNGLREHADLFVPSPDNQILSGDFVTLGGMLRSSVYVPLIFNRSYVTPKTLPRVMVDLEEIVTRQHIYDHSCTEKAVKGRSVTPFEEEVTVTCPGPLEISISETADTITLGAATTFVGRVESRSTMTYY